MKSNCTETQINEAVSSLYSNKTEGFLISVNELKLQNLGYYPFPLSLKDADTTFRFYNGEFVLNVLVDINELNIQLKKFQLRVECNDNDELPWKVIYIGRNKAFKELESYVGFHMVGRLASEFISLKWIIENVIAGNLMEKLRQQNCVSQGTQIFS